MVKNHHVFRRVSDGSPYSRLGGKSLLYFSEMKKEIQIKHVHVAQSFMGIEATFTAPN